MALKDRIKKTVAEYYELSISFYKHYVGGIIKETLDLIEDLETSNIISMKRALD